MYIEGAPVLHMLDDETHFSAAKFVEPLTSESIWETILTIWITVYTSLPNTVVFDDGSQFKDTFVEMCEIHDVEWQRFGNNITVHFKSGNRYHEPIRRTIRKLQIDHPKMKKEFLLNLAVKACNDTLRPEGVVPSALVFGKFPSLCSFLGPKVPRAALAQRAKIALRARKDMAESQAKS